MSDFLEVMSGYDIQLDSINKNLETNLQEIYNDDGVVVFELEVNFHERIPVEPLTIKWKIPSVNVKGVWKPTTDFNKRIQADWELEHMESRISIDAPVINLFGNNDENVLTFACSNAIDKLEMNACLREEDNLFYCHITFFSEQHHDIANFKAQLRFDSRNIHFSESLRQVSKWWETFDGLTPAYVPSIAKKPLYSTWYQFHQNLDPKILLEECRIAQKIGYEAIIIDDGWQTYDNNRGYDYTGDWQPDRIPKMKEFAKEIHGIGMKMGLWYSVPFCGKKSKAYQKFKGKFLTENHRWAPVFDPRYPEVRSHLIHIYTNAMKNWNLDGFKLDFIDDFHWYVDTPNYSPGMDYHSINMAVDRLLTDVKNTLQMINPEVFIEFRQKYTGPAMRKYGNMFRAFDCPGDATMNRVRIADIKMLCGTSAVHADMVTWHPDEPLEIAALQLANIIFGVPQLSILLKDAPAPYIEMIHFYTKYWNTYSDVLMSEDFVPLNPLSNYPVQYATYKNTRIYGVHSPMLVQLESATSEIHFVNAQIANEILVNCKKNFGRYKVTINDCRGNMIGDISEIHFLKGINLIEVPPCGIVQLSKVD